MMVCSWRLLCDVLVSFPIWGCAMEPASLCYWLHRIVSLCICIFSKDLDNRVLVLWVAWEGHSFHSLNTLAANPWRLWAWTFGLAAWLCSVLLCPAWSGSDLTALMSHPAEASASTRVTGWGWGGSGQKVGGRSRWWVILGGKGSSSASPSHGPWTPHDSHTNPLPSYLGQRPGAALQTPDRPPRNMFWYFYNQ